MFSRIWWLSTLERAAKTGVQVYFVAWTLAAGLADTQFDQPNADAFDLLFSMDNLKAAIVGAVYSLFTSILSTPVGADKAAPSLTVTETTPTAPGVS